MERKERDREEEEGERWTEVEKNKGRRKGWKEELQIKIFKELGDKKRKAKTEEEGQTEGDRRARGCLGGGRLHNRSHKLSHSLIGHFCD